MIHDEDDEDEVPRPLRSPEHPRPAPGDSGSFRLSARETRLLMEQELARVEADLENEKRAKLEAETREKAALVKSTTRGLDRNLIIACSAAVTVSFGAFFSVRSEAKDISDGGVKSSADKLASYKQSNDERIADLRLVVKETKEDTAAIKRQVEALLERFRVPNPAPPSPPDGGK